jgi:ADP-heptose:LPS heptosyltransferase
LAELIKRDLKKQIVFCGQFSDLDHPDHMSHFNQEGFINLIGKTANLVELANIFNQAALVISSETSAPHLSVAHDRPTIVISNVYGRFTPYPKEISTKYHAIYHPQISSSHLSFYELSKKYSAQSELNIDDISVESVFKLVSSVS